MSIAMWYVVLQTPGNAGAKKKKKVQKNHGVVI